MSWGRRCRKPRGFLQSRLVSTGEETDARRQETETPARAKSAARRSKIFEQYTGAADPHPGRIHPPAGAAQERGNRGHHRDVRFGAHRITRNRAGAVHAAEKHEDREYARGQARQAPRGCPSSKKFAVNVALLRTSAPAFAQADHLFAPAWTHAAALWRFFRRRPGNHR